MYFPVRVNLMTALIGAALIVMAVAAVQLA